jgi:hypothetical protein
MDFEVSVADSRKYLVCRAQGPITSETSHAMAVAMNQLAEESGIDGRLIDVRGQPNLMSVISTYDLAYKEMDSLGINRATKVASLVNAGDTTRDFAHDAIRNAGFNLRIFTDEAAAIAWLEE